MTRLLPDSHKPAFDAVWREWQAAQPGSGARLIARLNDLHPLLASRLEALDPAALVSRALCGDSPEQRQTAFDLLCAGVAPAHYAHLQEAMEVALRDVVGPERLPPMAQAAIGMAFDAAWHCMAEHVASDEARERYAPALPDAVPFTRKTWRGSGNITDTFEAARSDCLHSISWAPVAELHEATFEGTPEITADGATGGYPSIPGAPVSPRAATASANGWASSGSISGISPTFSSRAASRSPSPLRSPARSPTRLDRLRIANGRQNSPPLRSPSPLRPASAALRSPSSAGLSAGGGGFGSRPAVRPPPLIGSYTRQRLQGGCWLLAVRYRPQGMSRSDPLVEQRLYLKAGVCPWADTVTALRAKALRYVEEFQPGPRKPISRLERNTDSGELRVTLWPRQDIYMEHFSGDPVYDQQHQARHLYRGGPEWCTVENDPTRPTIVELSDEFEWCTSREPRLFQTFLALERWFDIFRRSHDLSGACRAPNDKAQQYHIAGLQSVCLALFTAIDGDEIAQGEATLPSLWSETDYEDPGRDDLRPPDESQHRDVCEPTVREAYGEELRDHYVGRPDGMHLRVRLHEHTLSEHFLRGRQDALKSYLFSTHFVPERHELEFYRSAGRAVVRYTQVLVCEKGVLAWRGELTREPNQHLAQKRDRELLRSPRWHRPTSRPGSNPSPGARSSSRASSLASPRSPVSPLFARQAEEDPCLVSCLRLLEGEAFHADDTVASLLMRTQTVTEEYVAGPQQPVVRLQYDAVEDTLTLHVWPEGDFTKFSTGDATLDRVRLAVHVFRGAGDNVQIQQSATSKRPTDEDLQAEFAWGMERQRDVVRSVLAHARLLHLFQLGYVHPVPKQPPPPLLDRPLSEQRKALEELARQLHQLLDASDSEAQTNRQLFPS